MVKNLEQRPIDHRKAVLKQMFLRGAHETELKSCVAQSASQLRLKGAKVRNPPKTSEQAAELFSGLPADALDIVRRWFSSKTNFVELPSIGEAIEQLAASTAAEASTARVKPAWRALLASFCHEPPLTEVENFLGPLTPPKNTKEASSTSSPRKEGNETSPTRSSPKKESQVSAASDPPKKRNEGNPSIARLRKTAEATLQPISDIAAEDRLTDIAPASVSSEEALRKCTSLLGAESLPEGTDVLMAVIFGLVAAARGDTDKEKIALAALSSEPFQLLEAEVKTLLDMVRPSGDIKTSSRLRTSVAKRYSEVPELDPETALALAKVTNQLPSGQFFAHVTGALVSGTLVELSPSEAKTLYKHSGDITAFPGPLTDKHHIEEIGLWRVEHRSTDKNTQFVVVRHEARVFDILPVPCPSSDPDSVRDWLQTQFRAREGSFPLFHLSDGPTVRIPNGSGDPTGFNFDKPLELYESLRAFQLSAGGRIVLGPLPPPTAKYDCAPPTIWLRRILKARDRSSGFPTFTKAQVNELAILLSEQDTEPLGASVTRGIERLANVVDLRGQIEHCVETLLTLPQVTAAIEEAKAELIKAFEQERYRETAEITWLQAERKSLYEQIEQANKELKQQEENLARIIKAAFERAREDGAKFLGEAAVFQALIGNSAQSPKVVGHETVRPEDRLGDIPDSRSLSTIAELEHSIGKVSLRTGLSRLRLKAAIAASYTCGAAGLIGARRGEFVTAIAEITSGAVYCQVSAGADIFSPADLMRRPCAVISQRTRLAMPLGEFLEGQAALKRSAVIDILGANRAPPEAFLPELIDAVTSKSASACIPWTDTAGTTRSVHFTAPVFFFLNFVSGESTFPLQDPLSRSVPLLPLDHPWGDEGPPETAVGIAPRTLTSEGGDLIRAKASGGYGREIEEPLAGCLIQLGLNPADSAALSEALLRAGRPNQTLDDLTGPAKRVVDELDATRVPVLSSLFRISRRDS
jgi:hypothetical protein